MSEEEQWRQLIKNDVGFRSFFNDFNPDERKIVGVQNYSDVRNEVDRVAKGLVELMQRSAEFRELAEQHFGDDCPQ
jgi:hypothetical protein